MSPRIARKTTVLVSWCGNNNLELNTSETKEGKITCSPSPDRWFTRRNSRQLQISWHHHLSCAGLGGKHHLHPEEGTAKNVLPPSAKEVWLTARDSCAVLQGCHREYAMLLADSLVWQYHQGPEETTQSCRQECRTNRRVRAAFFGGTALQVDCCKMKTDHRRQVPPSQRSVSALTLWGKVQGADGTDQPARQQLFPPGHRCSEPLLDCLNTVNVVYRDCVT